MQLPTGNKNNRGFVKLVIILIVVILVLSYFGFDLKNIAESPTSKKNFGFVWNTLNFVWTHFLKAPALWIWNVVIVGIIWDILLHPILSHLPKGK